MGQILIYTFGLNQLENGTTISVLGNNSQDIADYLALVYSQTAMGLAAGVFSGRANFEEQTRQQISVSRVPFGPFYTLVALNLLYAAAGGVITVIAIRANMTAGVKRIRMALSV